MQIEHIYNVSTTGPEPVVVVESFKRNTRPFLFGILCGALIVELAQYQGLIYSAKHDNHLQVGFNNVHHVQLHNKEYVLPVPPQSPPESPTQPVDISVDTSSCMRSCWDRNQTDHLLDSTGLNAESILLEYCRRCCLDNGTACV